MNKIIAKIFNLDLANIWRKHKERRIDREKLAQKKEVEKIEKKSAILERRELRRLDRHLRWEVMNDLCHGHR